MDESSDIPDVSGALNTLNNQFLERGRMLQSAREEATNLREDLERRDQKIEGLEREIDGLRWEVQRQSIEPRARTLASQDGQVPASLDSDGLPRYTSHGGFAVLQRDDSEYKDIWDDSTSVYKYNDDALRQLANSTWGAFGLKPEILRRHQWRLTEHPEFERRRPVVEQPREDDIEVDQAEEQAKEKGPDQAKSPKPATSDRRKAEKKHSQSREEDSHESDLIDQLRRRSPLPVRGDCYRPDRHRDSNDPTTVDRYGDSRGVKRPMPSSFAFEDRYNRKAICVYCWETDGHSDIYGRCGTCRGRNIRCVRKLCDHGLDCGNLRCPCLHPGQWNQQDTTWTVEEGSMPTKNRLVGKNVHGALDPRHRGDRRRRRR